MSRILLQSKTDLKMSNSKPRVIKDFNKLEIEIQEQIKLAYPDGFSQNLITFVNKDGINVSALPFETDEKYYLLRMTKAEAREIIEDDDDYDDDGSLKDEIKDDYEEKHGDIDYMADYLADEEGVDDDDDLD